MLSILQPRFGTPQTKTEPTMEKKWKRLYETECKDYAALLKILAKVINERDTAIKRLSCMISHKWVESERIPEDRNAGLWKMKFTRVCSVCGKTENLYQCCGAIYFDLADAPLKPSAPLRNSSNQD